MHCPMRPSMCTSLWGCSGAGADIEIAAREILKKRDLLNEILMHHGDDRRTDR